MDTRYNNKIVQGQWPSFVKVKTLTIWRMGKFYLPSSINSCNDFAQMKKCYQRKKWPQKTKPVDKQITHIEFSCTNIEIWLDITVKITILNLFCIFNQWSVSFNALRHVIHDILNNCIWPDDLNFERRIQHFCCWLQDPSNFTHHDTSKRDIKV